MAKKTRKPGKTTKTGSLSGFNAFFSDKRFQISFGIFLVMISFILLLAFASFLFTWKVDQNFNWSNLFENSDIQAENWSAKIGAILANQFMNGWFGLAAFSLPFLLFIYGFRLFKVRLLPLGKTTRYTIFITIWLSIFLSYLFVDAGGYLGSGPGGGHGIYMSAWLNNLIGRLGALLLLLLLLFVFLVFSFQGFLPFVKNLFAQGTSMVVQKGNVSAKASTAKVKEKPEEIPSEEEEFISDPSLTIELNDNELGSEVIPEPETSQAEFEISAKVEQANPVANTDTNSASDGFTVEKAEGSDEPLEDDSPVDRLEELGEYNPLLDLSNYKFPGLGLLADHKLENSEVSKEELVSNKNKIVETLSHYKIKIEKIKATIGPTITLYEIVPAPGIRISKIKNLEDDIALSLAALGIRIIAPIPGKGTIGIEVPNQKPEIVSMKSILSSPRFQESKFELPVAIGKTISNDTFVFDLTKMPHLLVAGATGQGKSVGLNAILTSLLYKKHPSELKLVLVDPKKVELTLYTNIEKHYLAMLPDSEEAIITDTHKVVNTLNSLTVEMDNRYDLLKKALVRNIKEYNAKFKARRLNPEKGHRFLPYIVLVVDEFADLIMTAGKEIEAPIARIAQLARAVGIHLIIATQRPSTNIITGIIKANFPARIAFRVTSMIDSRTILDSPGANQLIGRGDMLMSAGSDMIRLQCAFVDTPELEKITEFISAQQGYPTAHMLPEYVAEGSNEIGEVDLSKRDEMFDDAARLVVNHQQGSTSLIQRKFSIGYNRAGRIIDQLEAAGVVGPYEGSKARQVLFSDEYSLEQFLKTL